jgi:pSer/pThr/pTyr-binding forkhead associated (FHA) protein
MYRFSIARDEKCDVVLQGASVSRQHAHLTLRGDGSIQFEDANSTNGSYLVEGDKLVRISSTYLQQEACLQFGKVRVSLAEIMQDIRSKIRQERGIDS